MTKENKKIRYQLVDHLRVLGVILMIFFHFFYDLNYFGLIAIDFYDDWFWFSLPRLIVTLFLLSVAMSLRIVHLKAIKWRSFNKRFIKISFFALIISLITYSIFPSRWIYFGTLHCIALCSLVTVFFLPWPRVSLVLGLFIVVIHFSDYSIPWFKMSHQAMDYIPFFPWIGVCLIGLFLHHIGLHKLSYPFPKSRAIDFCAKRAFLIYLIHQPILFALCYGVSHFVKN